jgi:molecular chaperone DnaK
MLTELGDKVPADEKAKIEAAAKEVEDAVRGTDKTEIEKKAEALMQASQALAQLAGAQGGDAGAAPGAGAQADAGKQPDGDVVDAEFTEVKDKK